MLGVLAILGVAAFVIVTVVLVRRVNKHHASDIPARGAFAPECEEELKFYDCVYRTTMPAVREQNMRLLREELRGRPGQACGASLLLLRGQYPACAR